MDQDLQSGWYTDPWELHQARWMSAGKPTKLVRDEGVESYDELPSAPPTHIPERIAEPVSTRADDLLRADRPNDNPPSRINHPLDAVPYPEWRDRYRVRWIAMVAIASALYLFLLNLAIANHGVAHAALGGALAGAACGPFLYLSLRRRRKRQTRENAGWWRDENGKQHPPKVQPGAGNSG